MGMPTGKTAFNIESAPKFWFIIDLDNRHQI